MEKNFRFDTLVWAIFLFICSFASLNHGGMGKDPSKDMKHHVHDKQTIMKIIEIDGMVVDCIDIYRQPTLRHPLLINHTLQLKPNYPGKPNNHVIEASRPWNLSKSCPPGSIPVERTQRNSHFGRNLSINHWYMAPHHFRQHTGRNSFEDGSEVHEYSTIRLHGNFYGAKASINVWNPKTEKQNELSVSQIWVASEDLVTSLEAGWMVYPHFYGTDEPKFFTFYTVNHYLTGCYNIDCPGFVQTNRNTLLSTYLRPVSVYGGPQYVIDIEIFKDRITGNWWLRRQGVDMGYWPNQLVPSLAGGARRIDFGGEIAYIKSGAHTSTDMGSGHYPYEGFSKSSFFRKVEVLDPSYVYRNPEHASVSVDNGGCYDLEIGRKQDGPWGYFFFYGGPGRSEKCS